MNAPTRELDLTAQRSAAEPTRSVWVSANAGTGKTHLLIDRIARLLLKGTPPSKILCLTFTKAAAAEMSNRLSQRLGDWAAMDEAALTKALYVLLGHEATAEEVAKAQQLFAETLDAPDGMRIRTIHSFCESLLGRFPLEAGVAPHFSVIDDRRGAELRTEARDALTLETLKRDNAALAQALETLAGLIDEDRFEGVLSELDRDRHRLQELITAYGGLDALIDATRAALDVAPGDSEQSLLSLASRDGAFDAPGLMYAADILLGSGKRDVERGARIKTWLHLDAPRRAAAFFEHWRRAFLKDDGDAYAPGYIMGKKAAEANPQTLDALLAEQDRLLGIQERLRALRCAEATETLLRVGSGLLAFYENLKRARAFLDYDDLILTAGELVSPATGVAWVHYKLDGGIDHILVDEAQDTSPQQWSVITGLAQDFFSGAGAHATGGRTVFAVGDEKQSIYSFQGAEPAQFGTMKRHFATAVQRAGEDWRPVELATSFRSTWAIMNAVNWTFEDPVAADGLTWDGPPTRHMTNRRAQGGLVEIWPTVTPAQDEKPNPWDAPLDQVSVEAPVARLADKIAGTVRGWLDSGEILESAGRPIRPGDVMILVRTRGAFTEEMVRALKNRGIPVAGRDRIVLTDHLAIMDLIALGRFALLPEDDLNTATVLKGPFVEFDEEALFEVAYGRTGTLWDALSNKAKDNPTFQDAHRKLSMWLGRADKQPPFEFFAQLLSRDGGRADLAAHMGDEVLEPIDEFLSLAMEFERDHAPSMEGFLHWLAHGDVEVKRDLEQGRDEVRVMTVHGAKGLQANVVFLPDTCTAPRKQAAPKLRWQEGGDGKPGLVFWPAFADNETALTQSIRDVRQQELEQEYRRLLYVAMTRARDRLYVTGFENKRGREDGCWYDLMSHGLQGHAEAIETPDGPFLRYHVAQEDAPDSHAAKEDALAEAAPLPLWATQPMPEEPLPPKPLSPSRPDEEDPPVRPPLAGDGGARFKRGLLVHSLLQSLPDVMAESRADAARRFLASPLHDLSEDEQIAIATEVLAVLDDAALSKAFAPGSLAEAPIAGTVMTKSGPRVVSGVVDRLVRTTDEVLLIDYKTNRPAPKLVENVSNVYLRQLAIYRAALMTIFPDVPVRCVLLWTDGPNWMQIPDALLHTHMP